MTTHALVYAGQVFFDRKSEVDHTSLLADLRTADRLISLLEGAPSTTTYLLHRDIDADIPSDRRKQATYTNLERWAHGLASRLATGDRLVVVVSNHFGDGRLPVDGIYDPLAGGAPSMTLADLQSALDQVDCEQLVVASTCESGEFLKLAKSAPESRHGRVVFSACAETETLFPDSDPPRIVQHDAFVDALSKGDSLASAVEAARMFARGLRPSVTPMVDGTVTFLR